MSKFTNLFLTLMGIISLPIGLAAIEAPAIPPSMMTDIERQEEDGLEAVASLFGGSIQPLHTAIRPLNASQLPYIAAAPIYLELAEAYRHSAEIQRDGIVRSKFKHSAKKFYQLVANSAGSTIQTFARARMMENFLNGEGVPLNYEKAMAEAKKLMDQKDDRSAQWIGKLRLGQMLILGQGVELSKINVRAGVTLLEEVAAQTENSYAQTLARAYLASCELIIGHQLGCIIEVPYPVNSPVESAEYRILATSVATLSEIDDCQTIPTLNEVVKKIRPKSFYHLASAPLTARKLCELRFAEAYLNAKKRHKRICQEDFQSKSQAYSEMCELLVAQPKLLFPVLGPSVVGLWHPRVVGSITLLGMLPGFICALTTYGLDDISKDILKRVPAEKLRSVLHSMIWNMSARADLIAEGTINLADWLHDKIFGFRFRFPDRLFDGTEYAFNLFTDHQNTVPGIQASALALKSIWKNFAIPTDHLNFIRDTLAHEKSTICLPMISQNWDFLSYRAPEYYPLIREILQSLSQLWKREDIDLRDRIGGKLRLSLSFFDERARRIYDDNLQRALGELNSLLEIEGLKGFEYQPSLCNFSNAQVSDLWRTRISKEIPALREEIFEVSTLFEAITLLHDFIQQLLPNAPLQMPAVALQPAAPQEPEHEEEWQAMRAQEDRRRRDVTRARALADGARLEQFSRECEEKKDQA